MPPLNRNGHGRQVRKRLGRAASCFRGSKPRGIELNRNGDIKLNLALAVLLLALAVISLVVGSATLSPRTALAALFSDHGTASLIVRDIRLPRTLLALLIGATLGLAGAALQGLVRNPLAEPALFGAPQAAAAGASFVIAFGFATATSFAVPLAGIAGALVSVGGLVAIAGRRASLTVTLLAGLAFASFAGAVTALILNLAPNPFAALEIAFWLLGSLEDRSMDHVLLGAPFMLVSFVLLGLNGRAFRALTLGEDAAVSLGINLGRTRLLVIAGVALGVGAAVAIAGAIGFVGLVAPHLVRRAVGADPGRVLLPATLTGAALLTAADIVVRLVPAATEIKVGVLTAMIGVPFFVAMIFHERRLLEGAPS
jgi:iron complex transport system permease protein